jgi:hypothetical protein
LFLWEKGGRGESSIQGDRKVDDAVLSNSPGPDVERKLGTNR